MNIQKRLAYGGAAVLFAAGGITAATGAASASAVRDTAPAAAASWSCGGSAGPLETQAECYKSDSAYVAADFQGKGEHFYVIDHYSNGYSTIAYLKVEGSGTAKFSSGGKKSKDFNLSFSENKKVWVKVCTSDTARARCTPWAGPGTT